MPYEFITKNGLISQGNVTVTGSLITSQNVTASNISASGTGSFGYVGINITNPSSRLHISGSGSTTITITDDALYTNSITNDNSVMTYTVDTGNAAASSAAHVFKRYTTELVRIDQDGQVGIGTSDPTAYLHIYGQSGDTANIRLKSSNGRTYDIGSTGTSYGSANNFIIYDVDASAERLRINSSGYVGIGTISPNSKLEVAGAAGTASVSVTNTGNGRSGSFGIDGNGVYIQNSTNGDYFDLKNASGTSRFRVVYDNNTYLNTTYTSVGSLTASGSKLSVFGNLSVGSTYGAITASSNGAIFEGNVGIGTSNPSYSLDVTGNARVGDSLYVTTATTSDASIEIGRGRSGNGNSYVDLIGDATYTDYGLRLIRSNGGANTTSAIAHRGTGTLYITAVDAASISLETTNTTRMTITSGGNVGIGTSSPAQKLEVQSGSVLIRGDGTALFGTYYASAGENTFFTLHSGSGNTFHIGNDVSGTNYNTMVFTAATDTTGGKVGIGTSSPGSKLQINDNTPVLTIRANDGGVSRKAYIDFYTTFFNFPSDVGARRTSTIVTGFDSGTWGTEFLAFNVGSGSTNDAALLPIERVRIDGSGNVGIGTSSPSTKLEINGNGPSLGTGINTQSALTTGSAGFVGYSLRRSDDSNGGWMIGTSAVVVGDFAIYQNQGVATTPTSRILITTSGNVGIGTTVPVAKLQVAGNVSGSSFTSSISNAVGFLGTSSWAQNVVSASFATTAQTANALNTGNSYTIAGLTNNGTLSQQGTLSMGSGYQILATTGTVTNPGVSFVADTNTGFYTPSADNIGIVTNGSEKVRIDSSGNVGVGSSSPSSKFEVLTSAVGLANQPNIIGNFRGDTDGRSLIRVDNTSTNSGAAALQAGISFVAYSNVSSQPSANKHEAQIILGSTSATSVTGGQTGTLQIVAPQDIAFNVSASNTIMTGSNYTAFGYNAMYIARSGNVGIGTTTPVAIVDIQGTNITTYGGSNTGSLGTIYLSGNDAYNSGTAGSGIYFRGKFDAAGTTRTTFGAISAIKENNTDGAFDGALTFFARSGSNAGIIPERMRISSVGNVGIGTTSPVTLLNISSTNADGGKILIQSGTLTNNNRAAVFMSATNVNGQVGNVSIECIHPNNQQSDMVFRTGATDTITFGTERMRIDTTGSVGIGTSTPGALLELSSSTAASLLNIKGARGNNILYVSGSGNIGINSIAFDPLAPEALLISGSTYNIISADTNINTYGQVHTQNRNAGTAASSDLVATNNTGNEIGNYVDLGINSSGYTAAFIGNANDGYLYNTGSQFYIGNASPGRNLYFFAGGTSNTASMMLSASGNVGIGATSPNAKLDVRGYIVSDVNGNAVESGFYLGSSAHGIRRPVASNDVYLHTTTGNLYLGTTGNTSQQVTVLNSGNVGIGTVTPAAKLEISGSGNSALLNIKSPISGAILYVSGSGAVGINTTTVGAFTLQVNGSFGATTKSFIIDHPTKAGKKLMYGSLESPYHGIRLTGRDTLKEGKCKIELPDYIYKLILHDSVNIQLTGIKCNKTLYIDDINVPENYFTIAYDKAIFESYKDYDFFWDFTAIRADVPELITEL